MTMATGQLANVILAGVCAFELASNDETDLTM
jgi:hypothetical protein